MNGPKLTFGDHYSARVRDGAEIMAVREKTGLKWGTQRTIRQKIRNREKNQKKDPSQERDVLFTVPRKESYGVEGGKRE